MKNCANCVNFNNYVKIELFNTNNRQDVLYEFYMREFAFDHMNTEYNMTALCDCHDVESSKEFMSLVRNSDFVFIKNMLRKCRVPIFASIFGEEFCLTECDIPESIKKKIVANIGVNMVVSINVKYRSKQK